MSQSTYPSSLKEKYGFILNIFTTIQIQRFISYLPVSPEHQAHDETDQTPL